MPGRIKVTLAGFDDVDDMRRALHWIKDKPTELAASIGGLVLVLPDDATDHKTEISTLIDVLGLCINIDTLRIVGDWNISLEGFAPQLLLRNPRGFPHVRQILCPRKAFCPPRELLQMLQMMPNLRVCEALPKLPGRDKRLDAAEIASFDGAIRTHNLYVKSQDAELVIPLLLSGRWIAHTAVFHVLRHLLCALKNFDGPRIESADLVELTIHQAGEESGPTPLASWIAHSCRALRRLHIGAVGEDMLLIMETVLRHGVFRLRELSIEYSIHTAAAVEKLVTRLAALLLSSPPSLATLRVLRIGFSAHSRLLYGPFLRGVASFCRERRIVYLLRENAVEAASLLGSI